MDQITAKSLRVMRSTHREAPRYTRTHADTHTICSGGEGSKLVIYHIQIGKLELAAGERRDTIAETDKSTKTGALPAAFCQTIN